MTIQKLAEKLSNFFLCEQNKLAKVNPIYSDEKDTDKEIWDLIRNVRETIEWRENALYLQDTVHDCLLAIKDTEDPEDINLEADPNVGEIYDWLASDSQNEDFVDQCVRDGLVQLPDPFNLTELLIDCQQQRKFEVLRAIISYLEENLEEEEEEEEVLYTVEKWEERDRVSITLWRGDYMSGGSEVIAQWWDDDARQMFEDGFFDPKNLLESVLEYCKSHGLC